MGSASLVEGEAPNPPHPVTVGPYALGVYPVTNADYAAYVEATGVPAPLTPFSSPRAPVTNVSWDDALAYCTWAGGSLPTEAEWELAARGFEGRTYPWGEDAPDEVRAHFAQDWNAGGPCDVAACPAGAGPFGCRHLAGNVWEWCLDEWRTDAHLVRSVDPRVRARGNVRPLRGGCWRSIAPKLQGAYRNWSHRVVRHVTIGFRLCVRVPMASLPGAEYGSGR
jgi:formylglycine-generating enzyme required for sulfatase activity